MTAPNVDGILLDEPDPVRRALRLLQVHDEVEVAHDYRPLLMLAQDALGEHLGLRCTGSSEDGCPGSYGHSGGTCPIHEWVEPDDCPEP